MNMHQKSVEKLINLKSYISSSYIGTLNKSVSLMRIKKQIID